MPDRSKVAFFAINGTSPRQGCKSEEIRYLTIAWSDQKRPFRLSSDADTNYGRVEFACFFQQNKQSSEAVEPFWQKRRGNPMRSSDCMTKAGRGPAEPLLQHCAYGIAEQWICVVVCFLGVFTGELARAQVVRPPEPIDPGPINGEMYYLINQSSGLQMDLNHDSTTSGDNILVNSRSFTSLSQRWAFTKALSGNWKISNILNGLCLGGAVSRHITHAVQRRCAINIPTQEWSFLYVKNGYNVIKNAGTNLVLDVSDASLSPGAQLIESPLSKFPAQSQLWLSRPTFFRGNDSSLQEKAEYDRVAVNNASSYPWWHDAYLPGQDLLQIFKNNGMNMIRVRPASINTTVTHGGISFPITTGPYNHYTLALPPAPQIIPATAAGSAGSAGDYAETDWSGIDLAVRAKNLGMSVALSLFYDGWNTSDTPGNWAGATLAQLSGVPSTADCSVAGNCLMYNYVKQEMELYRAMGAWPDVVAIGNEVTSGMFNSSGSAGLSDINCNTNNNGGGTCFIAIQKAAMQAILDAASDTSDPKLLGPTLPPPIRCVHITGDRDLFTYYYGATTNGIPLDAICESYYPGWHGPTTQTQYSWYHSSGQQIAETNFDKEANQLGLPIFNIEDGVSYALASVYSTASPQDVWYGINPPGPSPALARQAMIDLNQVQKSAPNNLHMGMEWWAGEATSISGAALGPLNDFWGTGGVGLFDNGTTPGDPRDNVAMPVMLAMGGKLDPTLTYKFVNAANGRILETADASTAAGAALSTGLDTGVTGLYQQWRILSQAGNPEENSAIYPAPMDQRGDGYFQITNMNQLNGVNVLDSQDGASGQPVVQNPQSDSTDVITGNANQEWDIQSAGNCGDVPAKCNTPPLSASENYYTIINKATGLLLTGDGTNANAVIVSLPPAKASNGDFTIPAIKGQLWQIVPVHITGRALYSFSGFQPPVENSPTMNRENAGQAIPIEFGLGDDRGQNVIVPGYPTVTQVDCGSEDPIGGAMEADTSSNSGLSYNAWSDTYTYLWKTDRRMEGTCQEFTLLLVDGSDHTAYFQFR
jgi:arabinogalactan endo-1,4-beta-galactosidase